MIELFKILKRVFFDKNNTGFADILIRIEHRKISFIHYTDKIRPKNKDIKESDLNTISTFLK